MFSEEGHNAQNFGMPDIIDAEPFINSEGALFPKMNDWFNEQAMAFSNGDGAMFSRNFIGFNFPIGYQKSIGFEQQFTSPIGERAWDIHGQADIFSPSYNSADPFLTLAPTVFSLSLRLQRQMEMTNIGNTQVDMLFNYLTTGSPTPQQIREAFNHARAEDYLDIHRRAFVMMVGTR
jgi:hypothetical protein